MRGDYWITRNRWGFGPLGYVWEVEASRDAWAAGWTRTRWGARREARRNGGVREVTP